ncbi:xyloglucan-specific galacturonosyltransferase 1-like [Cucurbita moschata]|uniref:Xyloglucan-specific galacturonosyltransferase 1-like n=1 Tax=Cucurbita moschata TaxID=3662 RepID=A0A6J1FJF2_CUCMO|nr:xyloglucan-specific galacturonosyltransferase 1-like [Cucurbita moschata]
MAISVPKRRSTKQSKKVKETKLRLYGAVLFKLLYRIPAAIFLLLVLFLWSSSTTVISGRFVHVCVSSRKLTNLYCLSAGSQPNSEIPMQVLNHSRSRSDSALRKSETTVNELQNSSSNGYIKEIIEVPEPSQSTSITSSNNNGTISAESSKEINQHHSTGKNSTGSQPITAEHDEIDVAMKAIEEQLRRHRSWKWVSPENVGAAECGGRGIYVYELPAKFNKELVEQCHDMVPWIDFCKYFSNDAMGEPIPELGKGWFNTHQYALEPIFHSRVLKHPCRVHNPDEAKLFYVPYYGGLDILRWHFKNNVSYALKDSLGLELVQWLSTQKPWTRSSGKDHVFVLGKISWDFRRNTNNNNNNANNSNSSWGTKFLELDQLQNPIKLLIERQPWHENDVGIPHPTFFHPHSDDDVFAWQWKALRSERKNLVGFAGAARPDSPENIRSLLINHCAAAENGRLCRHVDCTSGSCDRAETVITLFLESEFCLQPPGDSPTRKSVFDSLISGCIPVFFDRFTAYYQYPWHLPEDYGQYSVMIDKEEVKRGGGNVVEKLRGISEEKREEMRTYIIYELLPALVYGDSNNVMDKFQDAYDIAINNLLQRVSTL